MRRPERARAATYDAPRKAAPPAAIQAAARRRLMAVRSGGLEARGAKASDVRRRGRKTEPRAGDANLEPIPLLEPLRLAGRGRLLAEETHHFHRTVHVRLAREANVLSAPALADEGERLGEPDLERELLEPRGRREVLGARKRKDGT